MVASLFLNTVIKLHGFPRSIVSDRDPLFISHFWQDLFRLSGTVLRMSSAYHPQTDGQTEVLNRVIEQYLRAFVHGRPKNWGRFIPWVEWSHNSSWSVGSGSTPYEITYGRKPFTFPDYLLGTSRLDAVEEFLVDRDTTFQSIRKKLIKAQDAMKMYADQNRREVNYEVNDWVLVKLRPYRQSTVRGSPASSGKLTKRYFGPFRVLERIGAAAYRLELPDRAKIHSVFHCSLLKPFRGSPTPPDVNSLPSQFVDGHPSTTPLAIISSRHVNNSWEVLVQWQGMSPDEATWENWTTLCQAYHLEDKVAFQGPWSDRNIQEALIAKVQGEEETKSKRRVKKPSYLEDFTT
ncbi:hypothetical protein AAZX31_14G043900 [Glycine max]